MYEKRKTLEEALLCEDLRTLSKEAFLKTWRALAFLNPGLHPDGFMEADSGWPEELKPFAEEAFRRHEIGEFLDGELYCCDDALKGLYA